MLEIASSRKECTSVLSVTHIYAFIRFCPNRNTVSHEMNTLHLSQLVYLEINNHIVLLMTFSRSYKCGM